MITKPAGMSAGEYRTFLRETATEILRQDDERKAKVLDKRGRPPPLRRRKKRDIAHVNPIVVVNAPIRRPADDQQVYVIGCAGHPVKVGIARDVESRLKALQTGHPRTLRIYAAFEVAPGAARSVEREVHRSLTPHRTSGEWFDVHPDEATAAVRGAIKNLGV